MNEVNITSEDDDEDEIEIMQAYGGFAYVYNLFMEDLPYAQWAELIKEKFIQNGILPEDSHIADLGCGTGLFTMALAKEGYSMVGIDNSEDMLIIANEGINDAREEAGGIDCGMDIIYSLQDMAEFKTPYELDGIVSICDAMNYIIDDEKLEKCFRASWDALRQGGVFIFDMKKEEFYREELADRTFADCMSYCAYIWDNHYDDETKLNEYYLTIFTADISGIYERCDEYHIQRAYSEDYVKAKLSEAGFINVEAFEKKINGDNSERIYFMAVKP